MLILNNHTHTCYSHDGKGTISELCDAALKSGISGFAVTDHCDCEYAEDEIMLNNISASFFSAEESKKIYGTKLTVLSGIEIGEAIINKDFAKQIINLHKWDVILGSVHAVRMKGYEMPFSVIDFSSKANDFINKYVECYFYDLLETAETCDFDILSHLTVIFRYVIYKYKRQQDIKKYYPMIEKILKAVIKRDKTLEINTSGFADGYIMPDPDILKMYSSLGGKRISLGSDSHSPDKLTNGLFETAEFLKKEGFDYLTYYKNRSPIEYKI